MKRCPERILSTGRRATSTTTWRKSYSSAGTVYSSLHPHHMARECTATVHSLRMVTLRGLVVAPRDDGSARQAG
jgi:hypothetical protein